MNKSCFICLIKPLVYFTYFSYGFVELRCPHSSNAADKALIRRNRARWCLTFAVLLTLMAMNIWTLYLTVTVEKFDYFSILTTSELVFTHIGLLRLIRDNIGWKDRLAEMQLMLCLWNYIGTFTPEKYNFVLGFKFTLGVIFFVTVNHVLSVSYFLYEEFSYVIFLNVVSRFVVGLIVTSTFAYNFYEFFYYHLFFKWTFQQIEREVRLVLSNKLVAIVDDPVLGESKFTRKLRKLRKLYAAILYSFRRMKKIRNSNFVALILIYPFSIISTFFIIFVAIRGELNFRIGHFLYLVKNVVYFCHLGSIFILNDDIQRLSQKALDVMFKIPLNVLNPAEAREVEILTKFLTWEQPTEDGRDLIVYRTSLLMSIIVDIITNSMIVIQLYFWFADDV